jgi:hypothetical protein
MRFFLRIMSIHTSHLDSAASYLVEVRAESAGRYTAQLVGPVDLQATATTREEAVAQLQALIWQRMDSGSLEWVEVPRQHPSMRWFGHAKDDPTFPDYLEEIRKFRAKMDLRENKGSGTSECSDISLTPTT